MCERKIVGCMSLAAKVVIAKVLRKEEKRKEKPKKKKRRHKKMRTEKREKKIEKKIAKKGQTKGTRTDIFHSRSLHRFLSPSRNPHHSSSCHLTIRSHTDTRKPLSLICDFQRHCLPVVIIMPCWVIIIIILSGIQTRLFLVLAIVIVLRRVSHYTRLSLSKPL